MNPSPGGKPLVLTASERARMDQVDALVASAGAGVSGLIALLGDPSWVVRRAVVASLAAMHDAAVEPLAGVLTGVRDDEAVIAAAVDALVGSTADVLPALQRLASHPNPAVAADAAQILGRRRNAAALPVLAVLVAHKDDNVAVAAIESLGRIGGRAAVDPLLSAVESGNFFRAFPAIDVLGRGGDPRATAPLAKLLAEPMYANEATRALGKTGDRAATLPLAELLARPSDAVVRVAATALADLFDRSRERSGTSLPIEETLKSAVHAGDSSVVARRLTQALTSADPGEQSAICRVLGVIGAEQAIPALSRLLDGPPQVAGASAAALRALGSASSPHLLQALRDGDSRRRLAILPVMSRTNAVAEVVACLLDEDAAVRALACDSLARIGNPTSAQHLFPLLVDPNPRVVQAAIGAIQALGGPDTERLALQAAVDARAPVRRSALRILAYFGFPGSVTTFISALQDEDPRVRDAAIQGLPFLDDPRAVDAMFAMARATDARRRASAMRALGQCPGDRRVPAYLLAGLEDEDAWVRYYACQALGRLRVEAAAVSIAKLLTADAGQVKVAAVEALAHLQSAIAFEALTAAARSADVDIRRAALIGLGIARRPESLPVLLEAVTDADAATRLVAVSALAELDGPVVLAALKAAAQDRDEALQSAAVGFLGARPGAEATRALVDLLDALLVDGAAEEQVLDVLTLPADGRADALVAALADADDELSPRLTSVLARMQRAEGKTALFEALRLPNTAARKAAAATLAGLGARDVLDAIQAVAQNDPDDEVRRVASLLLAQ